MLSILRLSFYLFIEFICRLLVSLCVVHQPRSPSRHLVLSSFQSVSRQNITSISVLCDVLIAFLSRSKCYAVGTHLACQIQQSTEMVPLSRFSNRRHWDCLLFTVSHISYRLYQLFSIALCTFLLVVNLIFGFVQRSVAVVHVRLFFPFTFY